MAAIEQKQAVQILQVPPERIHAIGKRFYPKSTVEKYHRLYGGFASSNFKVQLSCGATKLLKIAHPDLDVRDIEHQVTVLGILQEYSFPTNFCHPDPAGNNFVQDEGCFAMVLDYFDGVAGDGLLQAQPHLATDILAQIGGVLAQLHQLPPQRFEGMRTIFEGYPVCNTGDMLKPGFVQKKLEKFLSHPFTNFVLERLDALHELYAAKLPWGFIHADAFLDNTLFSEKPVKLQALVDWEDSCRGPLVLDLAVSAYAGCFTAAHELMEDRLEAMLLAYRDAGRALSRDESARFVDFMAAAALACGYYRFTEFVAKPGVDPVNPSAESYKVMRDRVLALESLSVRQRVESILLAVFPPQQGRDRSRSREVRASR